MNTFPQHVSADFFGWLTSVGTSYTLIIAAEIGDKSQLVCMSLAARYRALPVIFGAIVAFASLNTLAVIFGVAIANWVPDYLVAAIVSMLFAVFGIEACYFNDTQDESELRSEKKAHGLFLTTFILIAVAEFGDKTQLAVVALSSTALPLAVWIGATLALSTTTIIGVYAGRTLLKSISLTLLHRLSGIIFIALAVLALYQAYIYYIAKAGSITQFG